MVWLGFYKRQPTEVDVFGAVVVKSQIVAVRFDVIPVTPMPVVIFTLTTTGGDIQVWRSDRPSNYNPEIVLPDFAWHWLQKAVFGHVVNYDCPTKEELCQMLNI